MKTNPLRTSSILSALAICALWIGCGIVQTPTKADIDHTLEQAHDEATWEQDGEHSWRAYERQGDEEWRARSDEESLTRALANYELAYEVLAQDEALPGEDRREIASRLLLRRAHGHFLLGYMYAPIWRGEDDIVTRQANAALSCQLGASHARRALALHHDEAFVADLIDHPTSDKLAQVSDDLSTQALALYTMNAQCEMDAERGRRRWTLQPTVAMLIDDLVTREAVVGYGMMRAFAGSYYAQHGEGGRQMDMSREHFQAGIAMWPNNLLLRVMHAEHYATLKQDSMLFDREIETVMNVPSDVIDELSEENKIALARAKRLVKARDKLFY